MKAHKVIKKATGILSLAVLLSGCQSNVSLEEIKIMQEKLDIMSEDLKVQSEAVKETSQALSAQLEVNESLHSDLAEAVEEIASLNSQIEALENPSNGSPTALEVAETLVELLETENFSGLAAYAHPTKGVRFTPYTYVDLTNDLVFTGAQIANFGSDATVYTWGAYDGTGDPISMTPYNYYNEFVSDEDYMLPHLIGYNTIIGTGNMINNTVSAYPTADFVEFHFTGFDPMYSGMDWSSLTLVLEQVGSNWYLVGVIHGQWTI